jgi:hypothetical protein
MLRSILNKTIRTDTGYIQQLITSDTLADSADFSTFFDKLPVSLIATIGVIAAALLIITVLALVIILRRRKTERKLAAKQNEVAAEMEMNRARREFFGTVSHDMRTPLNGILGFTDLALKSDKPEEVRECLKKIRSSGNVLSGLVNDTLIMSRIENGKYVLHPETNELSDTVQGVLEPIRSIADEKGVALSADISAVQGHWVKYGNYQVYPGAFRHVRDALHGWQHWRGNIPQQRDRKLRYHFPRSPHAGHGRHAGRQGHPGHGQKRCQVGSDLRRIGRCLSGKCGGVPLRRNERTHFKTDRCRAADTHHDRGLRMRGKKTEKCASSFSFFRFSFFL